MFKPDRAAFSKAAASGANLIPLAESWPSATECKLGIEALPINDRWLPRCSVAGTCASAETWTPGRDKIRSGVQSRRRQKLWLSHI